MGLPLPAAFEMAGKVMPQKLVPVILIGPEDRGAFVEEAVAAGMMQYLAQPVSRKDLGPAIVLARARFENSLALQKEITVPQSDVLLQGKVRRAKGSLIQRIGFFEAEAHQKLQCLAQRERCTLAEAAARVIAAEQFFRELEPVKPGGGRPRT